MKKVISYLITIMMVFTMMPIIPAVNAVAHAASKQYTIDVGEQIEVSDITDSVTVRTKSSNKSVAKVSDVELDLNNGWQADYTITGVSEGTATITLYDVFDDTVYASYNITVSHFYTKCVVTSIGSCSKDEIATYTCGKCGYKNTVNSGKNKNNHSGNKVIVNTKESSCGKGYSGDTVCSDCGYVHSYGVETPAISNDHTVVIDSAVAATCTKTGLKKGSHCSVCGTIIEKQVVVPAKGHTEVIDAAVEPTKSSTGLTEGSHCSVCGVTIKKQEMIPMTSGALAHGVITKDTTISQDTVIDGDLYIQKGCTLYVFGTLTVNSNVYVFGNLENRGTTIVKGTLNTLHYNSMLSAGNYIYSYVYNYGKMSITTLNVKSNFLNVKIPNVTHTWGEWKVSEEATCVDSGKAERECSICGECEYKDITATGVHDFGKWYYACWPSCDSTGDLVRECYECYYKEYKTEPALGHDFGEWSYESADDHPTCIDEGFMYRYCKRCGDFDEKVTEALGHSYSEFTTSQKAQFGSNGVQTATCSVCSDKVTKPIAAPKTIQLSYTSYTYNGKTKKPTVKAVYDSEGNKISSTNYKVSYASGRKNVGKYKVTVTFNKNSANYQDKGSTTFKINPKGTSISKLTKGKKSFTVKWKKQSGKMAKTRITGYQYRYSTSSKMTGAKIKTVKGYSKNSKKISGLKDGKKYYVQVRTYKTVNGTKLYSSWSNKKTVTTEKRATKSYSKTIYVTRTGSCYHVRACGNGTYYKSSLSTALSRGLRPCKKCF